MILAKNLVPGDQKPIRTEPQNVRLTGLFLIRRYLSDRTCFCEIVGVKPEIERQTSRHRGSNSEPHPISSTRFGIYQRVSPPFSGSLGKGEPLLTCATSDVMITLSNICRLLPISTIRFRSVALRIRSSFFFFRLFSRRFEPRWALFWFTKGFFIEVEKIF